MWHRPDGEAVAIRNSGDAYIFHITGGIRIVKY